AELLDDQSEQLNAQSSDANHHFEIPAASYTARGVISEQSHASRTHKISGEEERQEVVVEVEEPFGAALTQKQEAAEPTFKLENKGDAKADVLLLDGNSADQSREDDQTLWKASSWHFVKGRDTEVVEKDVEGKSNHHESNWQLVPDRIPRSSNKTPASDTAYTIALGKSSELLPDVILSSRQTRGLLATEKTVASYSELTNGVNTNGYATLRLIASFAITGMVSISRNLTIKSDTSLCGGRCTISGSKSYQIFQLSGSITVTFQDLILSSGYGVGNSDAGAILTYGAASASFTNVNFTGNAGQRTAGAVNLGGSGYLGFFYCSFEGNTCSSAILNSLCTGAALSITGGGGKALFWRCTFSNNIGGIASLSSGTAEDLAIDTSSSNPTIYICPSTTSVIIGNNAGNVVYQPCWNTFVFNINCQKGGFTNNISAALGGCQNLSTVAAVGGVKVVKGPGGHALAQVTATLQAYWPTSVTSAFQTQMNASYATCLNQQANADVRSCRYLPPGSDQLSPLAATLLSLNATAGTLRPTFQPTVTAYSLPVNRSLTNVTLSFAPYDPSGSTLRVLNPSSNPVFDSQLNGTLEQTVITVDLTSISVGVPVTYKAVIMAWDGITVNTYTVSLTRVPNRDASLQFIATSPSQIDPPFATWTTVYATNVTYTITSFAIRALTNDAFASVVIGNPSSYGPPTAGSGSTSLMLSYGINRIPITVTAEDPTVVLTYTVFITRFPDPTIPLVWYLSGPPAATQKMTSTLTYTGAVNGGACAACTYMCLLDGVDMVASQCPVATAPTIQNGLVAFSSTFGVNSDGNYTLHVWAKTITGITGDPVDYTWQVDTAPPVAVVTSGPVAGLNMTSGDLRTSSQNAFFMFRGTDNGAAFCGGCTYLCQVDATGWWPCDAERGIGYGGFGRGRHEFKVSATDAAGNVQIVPTSLFWTIDYTPPYIAITSPPPPRTANETVQLAFWGGAFGSSTAPCDGCEYACQLDGGIPIDCDSPVVFEDLTEGWHFATVVVTDRDGASISSASCDWTVDLTGPTAQIRYPPPDPTPAPNAFFRLYGFDNGTDCAYACSFFCSLDSAPFLPCSSSNGTNTYAVDSLAAGDHSFSVYAIDAVGNAGQSGTYTWNINPWLPTGFVLSGPNTAVPVKNTSAEFDLAAKIVGVSCTACSVGCSLDGGPETPCSSLAPLQFKGLADGEHSLVLLVSEPSGNSSYSQAYVWKVDTTPPVPAIKTAPPVVTAAKQASFAFSATDNTAPGGGACRQCMYSCALFPVTNLTTCGNGTGTTFSGLGVPGKVTTYTFVVQATDPAGNVSPALSTSYNFTVNLAPPKVAIQSAPRVTNQTTVALNLTASSFGGAQSCPDCDFLCKLDNATWQSCVHVANSGAPRITSGGVNFTLSSLGGAANAAPQPGQGVSTQRLLLDSVGLQANPAVSDQTNAVTLDPSPIAQYYEWLHSLSSQHSNTVAGSLFEVSGGEDSSPPPMTSDENPVTRSQGAAVLLATSPPPPPPVPVSASSPPAAASASFDNSTGSLVLFLSGLSPGPHTLLINATDSLANSNVTAIQWSVEVDPPTGKLTVAETVNQNPFAVDLVFDKVCVFPTLANASSGSGKAFPAGWNGGIRLSAGAQLVGFGPRNASSAYTLLIRSISDGPVTVSLLQQSCFDGAGNGNRPITVRTYLDSTAPTVSLSVDANPLGSASGVFVANWSPITFQAQMSEAVVAPDGWKALLSNGQAGDLQILKTSPFIGSSNSTTGPTAVSFTATPFAEGWVNLSVPVGVLTDWAGNGNAASNQIAILYDVTAPQATLSSNVSATSAQASFAVRISFSERVAQFTGASIMTSGGSLASFADVSGDGTLYTAVVSTNQGQTVTIQLRDGAATDLAGNPSVASNAITTRGVDIVTAPAAKAGLSATWIAGIVLVSLASIVGSVAAYMYLKRKQQNGTEAESSSEEGTSNSVSDGRVSRRRTDTSRKRLAHRKRYEEDSAQSLTASESADERTEPRRRNGRERIREPRERSEYESDERRGERREERFDDKRRGGGGSKRAVRNGGEEVVRHKKAETGQVNYNDEVRERSRETAHRSRDHGSPTRRRKPDREQEIRPEDDEVLTSHRQRSSRKGRPLREEEVYAEEGDAPTSPRRHVNSKRRPDRQEEIWEEDDDVPTSHRQQSSRRRRPMQDEVLSDESADRRVRKPKHGRLRARPTERYDQRIMQ
ncbi:hypothetical protein KFL_001960010, partial [Klebsormidium nitens]